MKYSIVTLIFLTLASPAWAKSEQVVVTIKPLHSLVASVARDTGVEVTLLAKGNGSVHDYTLKPSDMKALQTGALLFYMGLRMETFLEKVVPMLPRERLVALENAPNVAIYPMRYMKTAKDLHAWLDPANAQAMVDEIARRLSETYPEYKDTFKRNAEKTKADIGGMDWRIGKRMEGLRGRYFVVFHDAYQYYSRHYQLDNIGAIITRSHELPSAGTLQELHRQIIDSGAVCVFSEPEFDPSIVEGLLQGTHAKTAVLDPEGALLVPGPDLYIQLMEGIASGMESCLR